MFENVKCSHQVPGRLGNGVKKNVKYQEKGYLALSSPEQTPKVCFKMAKKCLVTFSV